MLRRILDTLSSSSTPSSAAERLPILKTRGHDDGTAVAKKGQARCDSAATKKAPLAETDSGAFSSQSPAPPSPSVPRYVLTLAGCAALNSCNLGFDIGVNTDAGILVQQSMKLSDAQLEMFMGSINLFAIVGALVSSRVTGMHGLRASFVVSSVGFVVGILIMVFSRSFASLMFGRVFVGLGVGFGMTIGPMYISEVSPKTHRGALVSWTEIGCNIGILHGFMSGFFYYPLPTNVGWRLMFSTGCIMPVIVLALAVFVMSESPRWLVQNGRELEALHVLKRLYPTGYNVQSLLDEIKDDIEEEIRIHSSVGWSAILSPCPAVRRMMVVGIGVAICAQLSGIDAIQYYLVFVLEKAGIVGRVQQAGFLTALGLLKLLCIIVGAPLFDKLGRRPLMFTSLAGMICALLLISCVFFTETTPWLIVLGLATYLAFFSLGVGPLAWVIPSEIFSTRIRAKAMSVTTFVNRLTATFVTSSMLSIANAITWGGYFALLAGTCLVILLFHVVFLPETKGRALEDMAHYFSEVTSSASKLPLDGKDDASSHSNDSKDVELH